MSEAPKLKPCPFCGGEPYTRTRKDEDLSTHNIVDWHFVGCTNCDVSFGIPDGYDCGTAAEQWNTRTDAISPATAAKVLLDAQNLDGMTLLPNYVRAMLRTIAQEDTDTPLHTADEEFK